MNFNDFYGNSNVIYRLKGLIQNGTLPHAIIIEGEKGLGKQTLARIIAKSLVCNNEEYKPCDQCSGCIKANAKSHPDITYIQGSGKTMAIPVEAIRQIRKDAYVVPSEASKKVYILLNSDNTLPAAQNAFLKVFEEPPKSAVFIITCINSKNLLETIRSRAVTFSLSPVNHGEVFSAVKQLLPTASEQDIQRAADVSYGNIGKCIACLSDDIFIKARETVTEIVKGLTSVNELDLLVSCVPLEADRDYAKIVLDSLILVIRDSLAKKYGSADLVSGDTESIEALTKHCTPKQLITLISECETAKTHIERFVNMSLVITSMCSSMRKAVGK